MPYSRALCALLLILVLVSLTRAAIYDTSGQLVVLGTIPVRRTGMATKEWAGTYKREASISVRMRISSLNDSASASSGKLFIVIAHASDVQYIGTKIINAKTKKIENMFCCSSMTSEACPVAAEPWISASARSRVVVMPIQIGDTVESSTYVSTSARLDNTKVTLHKSGIYYLFTINCEGQKMGNVLVEEGIIDTRNPWGQLPAEFEPYLHFYGYLTLAYLAVGIAWFVMSIIHFQQLLMLQFCIAGVIVLSMVEAVAWYSNYHTWNTQGSISPAGMGFGVLMITVKATVARVLLLLVALGYSIVKATLGTTQYQIVALSVVYFVVSGLLNVLEHVEDNTGGSGMTIAANLFIIPTSILETIFYWWAFMALLATIAQVKNRSQLVKLQMYYQFLIVLIACAAISVAFIVAQLLVQKFYNMDELWHVTWMFSAFWDVLNLVVLLAIAWIWRPNANNSQYAYKEVEGVEMAEDGNTGSVFISDQVTQRQQSAFGASGSSAAASSSSSNPLDNYLSPKTTPNANNATSAAIDDYELVDTLNKYIEEEEPELTQARKQTEAKKD